MGTPGKYGKKRKSTTTPTKSAPNSTRKARKLFEPLSIGDFCSKLTANRLLSCGEGEQLGHPGRNTTKKPRAVDTFPQGTTFVQVAAGGVHSLVLTIDGVVYSCGVNEKGTVPVEGLEAEETIDKFSEIVFSDEIKKLGKIVQITAGASFSAALTKKGSVIAWGNLRDTQGEVNVHETLKDIQKKPAVVIRHKSKENWHIVKIAAGENHLAMLSNEGELLTFGEGSMGQLGRTTRTQHIRSKFMVDESGNSLILRVLEKHQFIRFVDVWARGFWTIGRAQDGRLFVCGLNNFGQLGVIASPKKKSNSGKGRRSASQHKIAGEKPATMEALNFDELDISTANQISSEDSSQEPDEEEKNVADESEPHKKKPYSINEQNMEKKQDNNASNEGEHKQNGHLTISARNINSQIATTSANVETEMQNPKEKEEENAENPKIIGQEEANKVTLLTWAEAFPADKKWKHISGVQHIVCCTEEGELYGIGKNTDNALGLGTWEGNQDDKHWRYDVLQHISVPNEVGIAGVDATLGASIFWTDEGKVYGFGCDTVGQLGLGIKNDDDDKIVPVPRQITSAHLDGFRVISVSMADNHALFLASSAEKEIQIEKA